MADSLRVLHIHSGNLYGGIEVLLRTLGEKKDLCPQMIPEYALTHDGSLADALRNAGAAVHDLGGRVRTSRPWTVLEARRRLRRLLSRSRFDIAVCHSAWPHAIAGPAVRATRTPLAFYLHDAANGRHWIERWARRTRPDAILSNSAFTASTARILFDDVPNHTLFCPVVQHDEHRSAESRATLRKSLDTPDDAVVVLQASRMEPWKGVHLHIEALGHLRDHPTWICWLAGGAQRPHELAYHASLRASARRLGIEERVRFLGHRSDVPSLMSAADIFCQPNATPEPFGIVFVEALSAGLPVIAAAMGGALEIIDETCGILVENRPPAVASALRRLIDDEPLRRALSAASPSRARSLCDPRAQMTALATTLHRIARPWVVANN